MNGDDAGGGASGERHALTDPTLAGIALGLGIAALVVALVPYLVWIALPVAVGAVVLGVLARSEAGRVHAVVGTVTGAVAIVVVLGWVALLTAGWSPLPLTGLPDLGPSGADEAAGPGEPAADIGPSGEAPDAAGGSATEQGPARGVATVAFDGASTVIELDDCVVVDEEDELHAEAAGPAGSVVLRATLAEVALTTVTGPERATRLLSGAPDEVSIERTTTGVRLEGGLTDLGTGQRVEARIEMDCG